jgi:hypothetical protein
LQLGQNAKVEFIHNHHLELREMQLSAYFIAKFAFINLKNNAISKTG